MKVYHGSDTQIEEIDLDKCKFGKDFGLRSLMIDRDMNELEATDIYYTSNTYTQLADESTEFYKKPWQEIYELLKEEMGNNN